MKKISLILLSIIILTVFPAAAQSVTRDANGFYCKDAVVTECEKDEFLVEITEAKGYAAQQIIMEQGNTYDISARVKTKSGTEIMQFAVDSGEGYTASVDVGTYVGGEYTRLSGSYTYNGTADKAAVNVYVLVGNGKKASYYIKDFKVSGEEGQSDFFTDVAKTDKYYEYIRRLATDGIISGKPGGVFAPDAQISRAEFITMLARGSVLPAAEYGGEFSDVAGDAWYAFAAAAALAKGLEEYSGKFNPGGSVTTAEALGMIGKILPENNITADEGILDRKNAAKLIFKMREKMNKTSYYVNPNTGDDANDGTEDAPFKTLKRAKEAVAEVNSGMGNDLYVYLAGGDYNIEETVKFTADDSGKNGFRIFYKNLPGETPVMQAGSYIEGWELHDKEKNIYKAPANGSQSRQLFVNGKRAVRARSEGGVVNGVMTNSGLTCDSIEPENFAVPQDLEFAWINKWLLIRGPVGKIEKADGKINITFEETFWNSNFTGNQYSKVTAAPDWYENAYELLDAPGEFYLSRKDDMFYYIPAEGEDINTITALAGNELDIFVIENKNLSTPFRNVTFDGISFRGTTWTEPSRIGLTDIQNAMHHKFTRAITGDRVENLDILNCRFENLGGAGVKLWHGVKNVNIIGNVFYDISAHAIYIGDVDQPKPDNENLTDENIKISNNYIEKCGAEYMSAVPLTVMYLKNSEITHNEIFDCNYTGIHCNWGFSVFPTTNTINMMIGYNYIHEVMKTLHDGGAIYCNGETGGTLENPNRIYRNYIVNQYSATSVIYTDEGSSYWRVHENVQDMTEGLKHWDVQYGSTWLYTVHDDVYEDNYVMLDKYQNGGTNCIYRNAMVYPDANWDEKPLEIIQQAGLEEEYRHLSPSESDNELYKILTVNEPDIKTGEKLSLNVRGINKAGDFIDLTGATMRYASDNPEIVSVDKNGVITGIKHGKTNIGVQVTLGDKVMQRETTVYVDDKFDRIEPAVAFRPAIIAGEQKIGYSVTGKTLLDRTVKLDEVNLSSSNPEALEVFSDGRINALKVGKAEIVVNAKVKNVEKTQSFTMDVIDYASPDVPEYTAISTKDIFSSVAGWEKRGGSTLTMKGVSTMQFATPTGQVTYKNQKFGDEILKFNLVISGAHNWPAITLRNRATTDDYATNCYMIDFTTSGIELQRWNEGARTAIFCDLQDTRIGRFVPVYTNGGEIEVGAITEENGVRIILKIDGETIINYLDQDEDRITQPGYLGIMTENSFFTVTGK